MELWRLVPASLLLLLLPVGCKDKVAQSDPAASAASAAVSQALAQAASAEAMASALVAMAAQSQTSVTGKVQSVGGELGTWDVTLSGCQSGEASGFYGADFYASGSDEMRLRYVHDEAAGDVVKVAVPSKKGALLVLDRAAKCSVLEGSVEKTNVNTWTPKGNIHHLNGHVRFDCTGAGKGRVSGEVTFSDCH
jgi:hypothetical protein